MREIKIEYTKNFLRIYKKLNPHLRQEVKDSIEKFKNEENHIKLKVHKLTGRMEDMYAFSVNYSQRIIFQYISKNTIAILLTFGDHDIYEKFLK